MLRPEDVYASYSRAWNDPERALALLEECWAPDGIYADDEVPDGIVGRAALADMITASHRDLPGFRVWETSAPRLLAGRLGLTWSQEGGDPAESLAGTDVIEFAPDGRIARVTGVFAAP
jgi:hypothetical protein